MALPPQESGHAACGGGDDPHEAVADEAAAGTLDRADHSVLSARSSPIRADNEVVAHADDDPDEYEEGLI